jgi:hypothetical protein
VAHAFPGAPEGANSCYSITPDRRRSFYGATVHGGVHDDGAVFRFRP